MAVSDDVFMKWLHGGDELSNFLAKFNSFHEIIIGLHVKLVCGRLLFWTSGLLKLMVRFILKFVLSLLMRINI